MQLEWELNASPRMAIDDDADHPNGRFHLLVFPTAPCKPRRLDDFFIDDLNCWLIGSLLRALQLYRLVLHWGCMHYARGARRALSSREFDPTTIGLILDRLERAVPHLHFKPWAVERGYPVDISPPQENAVKWTDNYRTELQVPARIFPTRLHG